MVGVSGFEPAASSSRTRSGIFAISGFVVGQCNPVTSPGTRRGVSRVCGLATGSWRLPSRLTRCYATLWESERVPRDRMSALPVLVLTGGPAVGKSSTALSLAKVHARCAVIDVDDVRQLIKTGGAAPWEGAEGLRQQELGVRNACALARSLRENGFDTIVADVLTPETADLYRSLLDDVLLIQLLVSRDEARSRAAQRRVYLTHEEFESLHAAQEVEPPKVDVRLDVTRLTPAQQREAVGELWIPRGLRSDRDGLVLGGDRLLGR